MATKRGGNNRMKKGAPAATEKQNLQKQRRLQKYYDDRDFRLRLQEVMYSKEYILNKIFRKDGPHLGDQFDSLPSNAFLHCYKDSESSQEQPSCQLNGRALKKKKVLEPIIPERQVCKEKIAPFKKHGVGKGLMTVWRVTNPGAGGLPPGIDFGERDMRHALLPKLVQKMKKKPQRRQLSVKQLVSKKRVKKQPVLKRPKVACQKLEKKRLPYKEKCELALDEMTNQENLDQFATLVDDEELELRELQAGPNPLTCCAHFASDGLCSCSLCKDLLDKFPPNSVIMKRPLNIQPWDSSMDLIKKLFKVFHFLYTYAFIIDICSFTLDEFAQAFLDEDSLLLGKIHMALLKLLLCDIETEIHSGFFPHATRNCKFVWLIHSVEHQESLLKCWKLSLNPLTWTEIFRQILVAAGFCSKRGGIPREVLNQEVSLMVKYGLKPGTLKGELFSILLMQGDKGMKVSELAKYPSILELGIHDATSELELQISSMLSSDITLFEKISSSAYRLRVNSVTKELENFQSDLEDFGSIDDESWCSRRCSSSEDSECDSVINSSKQLEERNKNMLTVCTEIDESFSGEPWVLGLMEGEYSDLSIEEKLNALVALIDILSAGSSFRKENQIASMEECISKVAYHGSGAKIKRSTAQQSKSLRYVGVGTGLLVNNKELNATSELQSVDSFTSILKICGGWSSYRKMYGNEMVADKDLHPMQSIFLGSDRRFNRYWLFLGPCDSCDPGHKRIYFESSEDGHWEVVDAEEALSSLLLVLDRRGRREAHLLASLEKRKVFLCQEMSTSSNDTRDRIRIQADHSELNMSREDSLSAVSDVDNNLCPYEMQHDLATSASSVVFESGSKELLLKEKWSHMQAFDAWIWKSFYSELSVLKCCKRSYRDSLARCESCHDLYWRDEKHCKLCHTTFELDFDLEEKYTIHAATCRGNLNNNKVPKQKVLPSQLQSLKAALYAIESVMPEDAFVGTWMKSTHNLWVKRLKRTSTLVDLLQVLADFVDAINEDWFYQSNTIQGSNYVLEDIVASFPTMPQTSSAVALWLVKLDNLIAPHLESLNYLKKQELCQK